MAGIKKNFIYNSVLTLSQYVFGLITLPYISRVLGVESIGIVGFVDNAINYFLLFAMMGIAIVGQREIAKNHNNQAKLNTVFSSLFSLSFLFTIGVLFIYIVAILFIPQFVAYQKLFYIGTAKIIATVFLVEWLYKGLEMFKYISICNIVIKILYVIFIFLFIKDSGDYTLYFILTIGSVVINAFINFAFSRKTVVFSFKSISFKPYIAQFLHLGVYMILTSMYTTFNVIYLGFVGSTIQVGYYWTALKIYTIVLAFYTAFTNVMMPRMTNLLAEGDTQEFKRMIDKSFSFMFSISFPIIIFSTMLAPQIISIIAGKGYEGAIMPMQIIMPLVFIVGIAQILAVQILIPMQKDGVVFKASIIGAMIGIGSNILLVGYFGSTGSAIVLVLSECIVTAYYLYYAMKKKIIKFPLKEFLNRIMLALPFILFSSLQFFLGNKIISLILIIICFLLYWLFLESKIFKTIDIKTAIHRIK